MSAYMSVDKLAEFLKSLGVENMDVTIEYTHDSSVMKDKITQKTAMIYEPPEVRIMAEGKCYKPAHVELQARDV